MLTDAALKALKAKDKIYKVADRDGMYVVGMEACASAHYWAREISAWGHDVRLLPPQYVKPFVKRGKTDAADAEAIAEAVTRKSMRFVPVKTAEQQAAVMVLKTRALLVRQRTQAIDALRAHMGELGIIAQQGSQTSKHWRPSSGIRRILDCLRLRGLPLPKSSIRSRCLPHRSTSSNVRS
jgi:transposase